MKALPLLSSLILLASSSLNFDISAEERTPLYGQKVSLFETLGVPEGCIVFLGNSLTDGCEWGELFSRGDIVNRGISGDTADGIIDRLSCVTSGKPAKIFLMVGVNDISHDLPADTIAAKVANILDRISSETPDTKVYLQSCLPINNSFGRYKAIFGKEDQVPLLNETLKSKAAERGITWIELYPLFTNSEGLLREDLTNDGLHLLAPGYLIWRDAINKYVNE